MKALVQHKFLLYDELCDYLGENAVNSLIAHNLMHLRLTKLISFDLQDQEDGIAVVTPETPCGYVAMERVLQKLY